MGLLLYFVVIALAMLGIASIMPGFVVHNWVAAIFASIVLAAVNAVIRPILFVLTLPFTIVTLGLFLFVLNGFTLWLTALIVPGFSVHGIGTTIVAALLLSLVGMVWKAVSGSGSRSGSSARVE